MAYLHIITEGINGEEVTAHLTGHYVGDQIEIVLDMITIDGQCYENKDMSIDTELEWIAWFVVMEDLTNKMDEVVRGDNYAN